MDTFPVRMLNVESRRNEVSIDHELTVTFVGDPSPLWLAVFVDEMTVRGYEVLDELQQQVVLVLRIPEGPPGHAERDLESAVASANERADRRDTLGFEPVS